MAGSSCGPLILRLAVIGRDPSTLEDTKLGVKALSLSPSELVGEVQAKLRTKVEEVAAPLGPDSDCCLLLPGQGGAGGRWLLAHLPLQHYMQGVGSPRCPYSVCVCRGRGRRRPSLQGKLFYRTGLVP